MPNLEADFVYYSVFSSPDKGSVSSVLLVVFQHSPVHGDKQFTRFILFVHITFKVLKMTRTTSSWSSNSCSGFGTYEACGLGQICIAKKNTGMSRHHVN